MSKTLTKEWLEEMDKSEPYRQGFYSDGMRFAHAQGSNRGGGGGNGSGAIIINLGTIGASGGHGGTITNSYGITIKSK